eukprot:10674736-Lingulodinium_polyedra.AAC.1
MAHARPYADRRRAATLHKNHAQNGPRTNALALAAFARARCNATPYRNVALAATPNHNDNPSARLAR